MHSQLGNCWKCGPVGKANLSEDEEQIHTLEALLLLLPSHRKSRCQI